MSERASTGTSWEGLRTSPRGYALFVLGVVSFVVGLFASRPLAFVSIPLIMLLGFTALRSRDPRVDVEVTRTTEKVRIRQGESTRVRLRVSNLARTPVSMLQVADHVPAELRGKRTISGFSLALGPEETRDLYYEVSAGAFGVHKLGPIRLSVQDATGLFESQTKLGSYTKMTVFPESTERLRHFAIRPRRTKSWPGEIVARRTGAGLDYYNIRQFMPGDSAKRINWRASARHDAGPGEFLVNEYMAEVGAEVLIIVDAGREQWTPPGRESITVHSAKAAISIAERLLHDRNRVGLLTTGANPSRIAAGYGRRQFDRIALSLLQLRPGAYDAPDIRWRVEASLHTFFPNVAQVVFVSPLADENAIAAAADVARGGWRDLIVVSPNPLDLGGPASRSLRSREGRIARRLTQMEREADMEGLREANALVVDWTTSASLEEVMEVQRRALARHAAVSARSGR